MGLDIDGIFQKDMKRKFRYSIRLKLLLVSLTLLGIPWAGYQLILEAEKFLRSSQQDNLQISAQSIASIFSSKINLFNGFNQIGEINKNKNLYLHEWEKAPIIDGYSDDWRILKNNFTTYRSPDKNLVANISLGEYQNRGFLLLQVEDRSRSYGRNADRLEIIYGEEEKYNKLVLQPETPGWIIAKNRKKSEWIDRPDIRGDWQDTVDGYIIELELPLEIFNANFSFSYIDSKTGNYLQPPSSNENKKIGRIVKKSSVLQKMLDELTPPTMRIWVVDHEGLVLAKSGNLKNEAPLSVDYENMPWLVRELILAVLPRKSDQEFSISKNFSRLDIDIMEQALVGRPSGLRRKIPESDVIVATTAVPIKTSFGIIGGILAEQTTNAILSIQNSTLQRIFTLTFLFLIITGFGLLAFSSFLILRIRKLRDNVEQAVTFEGRITNRLKISTSKDEIGELERGLDTVLGRLQEYNYYLEAMASRLSHEIKNPLSIVKTSLDNLSVQTNKKDQYIYIERAYKGIERLEMILRKLNEATSIEQALKNEKFEEFDIVDLSKNQIDAYRQIWPKLRFKFDSNKDKILFKGIPDLIIQAMDKLTENAIDFHRPGTEIKINLHQKDNVLDFSVSDEGALLPQEIDIFQSMVSIRNSEKNKPHLGLGLYLLKMISEHHQGIAYAKNNKDLNGVCIGIKFSSKIKI
tara:strand:- start:14144 stop:16219 length:2076 start_codon:yes stop_codon:yes gene_type:complete